MIESFLSPEFLLVGGFPALMCLWFMWRFEPLLKANNEILALVVEHLRKEK